MKRLFFTSAYACSLIAVSSPARADVFELRDGGSISGALVERTDEGVYKIRTAEGAELSLDRNLVQRIVPQNETMAEYERRSRTAPDTAEAHRELAAWCREHQLDDQLEHHLRRVVDLDPTDEDARRSLGQQKVGDRWLGRDDVLKQRGLIFFEGKWRTPQDIAIRQRDAAVDGGEADWVGKVRLWRSWLDSHRDDRVTEAQTMLANLNDPQAAPALVRLLDDEADAWAFDILLAALARLDHPETVRTLVAYSLEFDDPDSRQRGPDVRADCVDYLLRSGRPVMILPYVQALNGSDNEIVNRAAEALMLIGDEAAVSPLIDALVTRHKYEIQPGNPGGISAGFSQNTAGGGGGGFSFGGNGPQIIRKDQKNPAVLSALTKLTGQNFDYDEQAWRNWYVDQRMHEHANARRDL
jgi:hypothetical protein